VQTFNYIYCNELISQKIFMMWLPCRSVRKHSVLIVTVGFILVVLVQQVCGWAGLGIPFHPCFPFSPRRAVTTRIRRVSGKRPAICCCLDLWEVIQLVTFPPFFGKHIKLVPTLRRFLAHLIYRVLVMLPPIPPSLFPRCSLDALNSIEFLQRWISSS